MPAVRLKVEFAGPVHTRVGPGIDVAPCGARGTIRFASNISRITCPGCREKYKARQSVTRAADEIAARRRLVNESMSPKGWYVP